MTTPTLQTETYRSHPMKLAAPLLLLLCLFALPACQSAQQVHDGMTATAVAVNDAVVEAHNRKLIGDDDFRAIYPHLRAANGALVLARGELPEGGKTFEEWIDTARDALAFVKAYLVSTGVEP